MATEDSLDIFGVDPFGRDIMYGLSTGRDSQGLAPYGFRYAESVNQPITAKGRGYLGNVGTMQEPMTELSASSDFGGRTVRYPLIVPTLTADELNLLRSGGEPTQEIYGKAESWARSRLAKGQDPFADTVSMRFSQPEGLNPAPSTDQMRPTPRSPILGLFSDIVNLPLQYMSSPERTQQMQGTAQLLYGTGIPKTLERMSYGDSLFSGAGGLGGTTRMRPETAEALMNVAPFAPVAGRLASRAVRATEGMPVGMSIKDVGKSSITREGNPIQSAVVLVGDKIFMGRTHGDALNRAVYEGVVRKEGGKYIFPKGAEVNSDLFMTKDGQIIDRLQASKMFDIGASETAIEKGLMQNNPPKSMTVDSYIEEATALKKQREQSPYPQQAALNLAQQRAALPVEQGGLGLPANNTAADRAKAMGFDMKTYHGTNTPDITSIDVNRSRPDVQYMQGFFTSDNPNLAGNYGDILMPLLQQKGTTILDRRVARQAGLEVPAMDTIYDKQKNILVTNNPANIRSRFAAFDPFRKDVATATAMGVALPDLLAQPVNQYQPTYETIPMYTDPFGNTIGSSIR